MSISNIHQLRLVVQGHQDGDFMDNGISISDIIHGLLIDYGHYQRGCMWIDAESLTTSEKKLILPFIVDQSECKDAFVSSKKLDALYKKHQNYIQSLIDQESDRMFFDNMREHGSIPVRNKDNGETTWRHR